MKNIIKVFFASLVILVTGCTEKGPVDNGNDKINENIEIIVKALKVEGTTATIKVEHDGTTANPWYGFLTTETDAMKAYQNKVKELTANGKIEDLNYKTSLTKTFKDLEPNTNYLYVAFGITEEGEIYGIPASAEFKTGRNSVELTENTNWKISYVGEYKDDKGEVVSKHTVLVETSDKNKFFVTQINKLSLGEYDIADKDILTELVMTEFEYFTTSFSNNSEMDPYLLSESTLISVDNNIIPGDWYFMAVGVDEEYQLSGYYAISELTNIPEEEATPEYAAWLGDWTFTGENGVSYDITFEKGINNIYYLMSGWEGVNVEYWGCKIPVYWDASTNEWVITNNYFYTAAFGDFGKGDLWVFGADDEYVYTFTNQQVGICYSETDTNGGKLCKGMKLTFEDNSSVEMKYMQYVIVFEDGNLGQIADEGIEWPSFPITITPKNTESVTTKTAGETTVPNILNKKSKNSIITSKIPFNVSIR